MLIRTRFFLSLLLEFVLCAAQLPQHFHNYAGSSSVQNGYDVQNPYSYPLRNTDISTHVSPIIDNRTNVLPPNLPSSISYVPVHAPAIVPAVPSLPTHMNSPSRPSYPQVPQMNGHLAQQMAQQSTSRAPSSKLPYPTYETDALVEMRRQMALAAEQQRIQMLSQTIPTTTTAPSSTEEPRLLSQLSPEELAAYASRLRSQFQQEKQITSTQSVLQSNLAIRGRVNAGQREPLMASSIPVVKPASSTIASVTSLPIAPQFPLNNLTNVPLTSSIGESNGTASIVQQILPVQLPLQPAPKLTHEINYCDRRQFDDDQLAALHLKRSDYFIYNISCAGIFFQCAIGQTFVLKCPSVEGQAFDPAIGSCNFRNSVRFCPEYDHVLHCTIRETCTPNEFACCALPQQCIEYSRRCDGHRDCAEGDDENNCPSCARDQFACVKSGTCISAKLRCDGHPDDCGDGSNLDEIGCSKNETCLGKFVCDSPETLAQVKHSVCVDVEKYCDGKSDCPGAEDELNCRLSDEPATKYLSCENQKQQVRKEQWCDGREDCLDSSDEKYCF